MHRFVVMFFVFAACTFVQAVVVDFQLQRQSTATASNEWTQHGFNAQRTSYNPQPIAHPWRWKWSWNGPSATGGVSAGKRRLGRITQPITGGGRVYIASGYLFNVPNGENQAYTGGVVCLSEADGSQLWNVNPGGSIVVTPAYDPATDTVIAVSTNGYVYKMNAANGAVVGSYNAGAAITTPPCLIPGRVFVSAGNNVIAINTADMTLAWSYAAGSVVQTAPSYSSSRNRVVVGTADLFVHAINNTTGSQAWRVKPTVRNPSTNPPIEYTYGWPVIAEVHGLVLIKIRLDWGTLYNVWSPWPTANTTMRTNLTNNPGQQALFALSLDNGTSPFICNIGHGGYGDGDYMPMGPMPVVKRFNDNTEVVYTVIRGHSMYDGRWDSHYGEMMLDDTTVSGYLAGYVRFIYYDNPWGSSQTTEYLLTDEQPNVSMAGDYLFGAHWMAGMSMQVGTRTSSFGSWSSKIQTTHLASMVTSINTGGFSSNHYRNSPMTQQGDARTWGPGFYMYYNQGTLYDNYWTEYAQWVPSKNLLFFRSCDGAVIALESGDPMASLRRLNKVELASVGKNPQDIEELNPSAKPRPSRGPSVIPHESARRHPGELKTVYGSLAKVFNNGKAVYLCFRTPHQGSAIVRIMKRDWGSFPMPPEQMYHAGDQVRVTGRIAWYQGDPVIYVSRPEQIEVVRQLVSAR
jgi:hypothetical protein